MTAELKVGQVVMDTRRGRVVKVRAVDGGRLTLARPQGLAWREEARHCRPATPAEQREYEIAEAAQKKAASYCGPPSPWGRPLS